MAGNAQPAANFIGVDVSGATMHAALISSEGAVLERRESPLNRETVVAQVAQAVMELRDVTPNISAVGIGIPGLVNRQTDRVLVSTDLPSIVRGDIHAELMKATGLRVELENDANAAAYGEYKAGAGVGARNMFYMMIGNGIGGAIVLDGKLWTGASGFAGEVGHITIDAEGLECACGN